MNPQLSQACDHLIDELNLFIATNKGKVDLISIYGLFTADAFAQCIFGIEVSSLHDKHLLEFKSNAENTLKM